MRYALIFLGNPLYMIGNVAKFALRLSRPSGVLMKKWFIPLLAFWLYGCSAGPGEEDIRQ